MPAEPALRLTFSGDIQPDRLADLTRGLVHDLASTGAGAKLATREAQPGERAMELDLFTIAITFITHSTAHLAADYIKGYLAREKKGQILIVTRDGRRVAAFDHSSIDIDALAALLKEHLPPAPQ